MSCNLAVTITKAALLEEHLRTLIHEHLDGVTEMMHEYLRRRHPRLGVVEAGELRVGEGLTLSIGGEGVTLTGPRTSRTAQYMEDLSSGANAFLKLVADQLFTMHVEQRLKVVATITGKHTSDVTDGGVVQRATVYAIGIKGLNARVFVLPGGRLQIFVDTGSFEQAKAATLQLLQGMQVESLSSLQMQGEVEQHRDGHDHVHVRQVERRGGN
jgi:hypothetical protein